MLDSLKMIELKRMIMNKYRSKANISRVSNVIVEFALTNSSHVNVHTLAGEAVQEPS